MTPLPQWHERPDGVPPNAHRPHECTHVVACEQGDAPHSMTEAKLYGVLLEMNKAEVGDRGWRVDLDYSALEASTGLSRPTIRRTLNSLTAKHSVRPFDVETGMPREPREGESLLGLRRGCGHKKHYIFLARFSSVLAARKDDPKIGHMVRPNGTAVFFYRGVGRRLMTPEEMASWRIPQLWPKVNGGAAPAVEAVPAAIAQPMPRDGASPELAEAIRAIPPLALADDAGVKMVSDVMRKAAADKGCDLSGDEMVLLVQNAAVYARGKAVNCAYLATVLGGRTRQYLNRRGAAPARAPDRDREERIETLVLIERELPHLQGDMLAYAREKVENAVADELAEARRRLGAAVMKAKGG